MFSLKKKLALGSACLTLTLCAEPTRFLPPVEIASCLFRHIEVAHTPEARAHGLMERDKLLADGGMLFLMEEPQESAFWMKNTRIPLDCLFLDRNGKILAIHQMPVEKPRAPQETEAEYERRLPVYPSHGLAKCALELRQGTCQALGLKPGMTIPALAENALPEWLRQTKK